MSETVKKVAIVAAGGKQYLVEEGMRITVNQIDNKEEDVFELPNMLGSDAVSVKVIIHKRGPKITGLKFKSKVRYIRHYGHRQPQTILEVVGIGKKSIVETTETAKQPAVKVVKTKGQTKKSSVKVPKND